jgi:hypothetical protein
MEPRRAKGQVERYVVELTPAQTRADDIQSICARSRSACRDLSTTDTPVRFLRSVFVPEDGSCFLLFEAVSALAVLEASRLAGLGETNVSGTLRAHQAA